MTVASEISRLQTAKADARTSIINKGVNVPASAKLDTYHTYIDQIQQGGGSTLMGKLKLYNNNVVSKDGTPRIHSDISFSESGKYYGCCVCNIEGSAANSHASYLYTYRKLDANNDMDYVLNGISGDVSGSIYTNVTDVHYLYGGMGLAPKLKIISFVYSTYITDPIFCYETIWEFTTSGNSTSRLVGRGTTTNLSDYGIDYLYGRYDIPSNDATYHSWVDSVTGNNIDNDAYIYLTLK